jgi:hypothetical protein
MKPFTDSRRTFWIIGMGLLVGGFIAAAVFLPATAPEPGAGQPDVRVPKMENVPPPEAEKLKLDVKPEEE